MFIKILFIITAADVAVNAQSSTSTRPPAPSALPSITPCVLACVQPAAALNGCVYTDPSCACDNSQYHNTQYQADVNECIREHCTSDDYLSYFDFNYHQCNGEVPDITGFIPTPRPLSFSLPSSTTSGAAATHVSSKVSNSASAGAASHTPSAAASKAGHNAGALVGALLAGILAL